MNNETLQWILDYAANSFESEEKRKEKIRERAHFIIGVGAPSYIAVSAYLISSFKGNFLELSCDLILFSISFFIFFILLSYAIIFAAYVALRGFDYGKPPNPEKVSDFITKESNQSEVLNTTKKGLLEVYLESVKKNSKQNQNNQKKLLKAQRCFFSALLTLIICTSIWVYNFMQN